MTSIGNPSPMYDALTRQDRQIERLERQLADARAAAKGAADLRTEAARWRKDAIEALAECRRLRQALEETQTALKAANKAARKRQARAEAAEPTGLRSKRGAEAWAFQWYQTAEFAPTWARLWLYAEATNQALSAIIRQAIVLRAAASGRTLEIPKSMQTRGFSAQRWPSRARGYSNVVMPAAWAGPLSALGFSSAWIRDAIVAYLDSVGAP